MNKHNNSGKKSEPTTKRVKSRDPMRRDTKEVLAELVGKLKEKLDPKKLAATCAGKKNKRGELRPNLDRLTVGVDLGDQWSNYCILDLEGETLAEGQLRTTQEDLAEFFQALNAARVVFEVGTHSPWVQEVIGGCGHEVLVANPRMMDGSKRRKRKNDRCQQVGAIGASGSAIVAPDAAPQSGSAARSGGITSPRRVGGGADRADQRHARTGEEYGHTASQMF
ncbi:MAG: transposase [Candidatus Sulfotelmatobacter sp.]